MIFVMCQIHINIRILLCNFWFKFIEPYFIGISSHKIQLSWENLYTSPLWLTFNLNFLGNLCQSSILVSRGFLSLNKTNQLFSLSLKTNPTDNIVCVDFPCTRVMEDEMANEVSIIASKHGSCKGQKTLFT